MTHSMVSVINSVVFYECDHTIFLKMIEGVNAFCSSKGGMSMSLFHNNVEFSNPAADMLLVNESHFLIVFTLSASGCS